MKTVIRRSTRTATGLCVLLVCLWLLGCGKVLPIHYYDLRYPSDVATQGAPKHDKILAIAGFQATSVYRQSRILYRVGIGSSKVGFYDDRRWVAPPTELVTQAAILHFRNLRLFANVVPYADRSPADYVLRGRITELEEVDLNDGYYGKITIFADLIELESGKIVWSGPVQASRKTTIRDVDVIVDEIAQGVLDVLKSLSHAIEQALAGS